MPDVLIFKAGSKISSKQQIYEGYETEDGRMIANVSVDKIKSVMQHFIVLNEEPLFWSFLQI